MDENMNNVVNNETEDLVEITNDQVVEQASSKMWSHAQSKPQAESLRK